MPRRLRIIANPVSGRGRSLRTAREVVRLLEARGCTAELVETRGRGDGGRIAADSAGWDAVVGVGGDGTLNEILNGLPASNPPAIGIIPAGTANVLAKELDLPRSAEGLARVLAEGRELAWDCGIERVGGRRFLLFASAGFDARVVHDFHARRTGPIRMAHYVGAGLGTLGRYEAPRLRVEIDGTERPAPAAWVVVSNVASYGGPIVLTPGARNGDGLFEVLVQEGAGTWNALRLLAGSFAAWATGCRPYPPGVSFHPARRVRITAFDAGELPLQIDGDPGGFLPADLEMQPSSARILAP